MAGVPAGAGVAGPEELDGGRPPRTRDQVDKLVDKLGSQHTGKVILLFPGLARRKKNQANPNKLENWGFGGFIYYF